jgi:translation elongation factor aEF-1 beta
VLEVMARVIVTLRVMPKEVEVDLGKLESKIKALVKPDRIEREPIAFGLVVLLVTKIIPDDGSALEAIEKKIKTIKEVGEVEVIYIRRTF